MLASPEMLNWEISSGAGVGAVRPKSVSVALVWASRAKGIVASTVSSNAVDNLTALALKGFDDLRGNCGFVKNVWSKTTLFNKTNHPKAEVFMANINKTAPLSFI